MKTTNINLGASQLSHQLPKKPFQNKLLKECFQTFMELHVMIAYWHKALPCIFCSPRKVLFPCHIQCDASWHQELD